MASTHINSKNPDPASILLEDKTVLQVLPQTFVSDVLNKLQNALKIPKSQQVSNKKNLFEFPQNIFFAEKNKDFKIWRSFIKLKNIKNRGT